MVFTTTNFVALTTRVFANLGLPQGRVVVVDHPLGGTDEATIVAWADAAVDAVLTQLTKQEG